MPVIKYLIPRSESIAREKSFYVTLSLNPSPRGRDLLRHISDGKQGVSHMRNLNHLINQTNMIYRSITGLIGHTPLVEI